MKRNSQRFLTAFIEIEGLLKRVIGISRYKPFYQLVQLASKKDPFVKEIGEELKGYGDLRNVIVHERVGDDPIAEPHDEIVARLERIRDLLAQPPQVKDDFLHPVVTCSVNDSVVSTAKLMYDHSFSKIPVYDGDQFVDLLTAEAMAHWLGHQVGENNNPLIAEKVSAVLKYVENQQSYQFVSTDCSLFEVLRLFDRFSQAGHRLQAILITECGTPSGKPLGIITVFDLPRVYGLLEDNE